MLKKINQQFGITIVVITHEMRVIEEICHRVAIIDHSQIAEVGEVEQIFVNPQSDIARRLIFPGGMPVERLGSEHCVRIVFDGNSSFEPVVANLVLECGTAVNILFADTKDIDGRAFGQMLIQLPDEEIAKKRVFNYLSRTGISYKEETLHA